MQHYENTLQITTTNANRQNTCKLRKQHHQFDNPRTAFKKSTAKTENPTEVFPGTHKSDGHPLVFLFSPLVLVTPAQEVGYDLGKRAKI